MSDPGHEAQEDAHGRLCRITEPVECNRPFHQDGHHGPECRAVVVHACNLDPGHDLGECECVCGEIWPYWGEAPQVGAS